ncbi:hypothetical protein OIO90_000613 [Microbotryomycetes sp. JL221]|nr:hypothetical protein OIO90_000613 [Microbotryomycetes sp. JL221]
MACTCRQLTTNTKLSPARWSIERRDLVAPCSLPPRSFSTSASSSSSTPWFVQQEDESSTSTPSRDQSSSNPTRLATAPEPTEPPTHLSPALHGLHRHLSVSPFLDKTTLTYINAREADPDSTWVDWVVLATLRAGRERGIRGAVESVRQYLATNPIVLSEHSQPFAPESNKPIISGLPPPPSRHARSKKGGQVTRQDNDWAMLDAGDVVVHVMTADARELWDIETLWQKVQKDSNRTMTV